MEDLNHWHKFISLPVLKEIQKSVRAIIERNICLVTISFTRCTKEIHFTQQIQTFAILRDQVFKFPLRTTESLNHFVFREHFP